MRTFATKQPSNQDATHQKPVRANPAPVVRSLSTGLTGSAILQRQPGCACGGGCPRCQESSLQTKLKISEPGDQYEQEADLVAAQVMRMPEPSIQRQMEPEEDEEEGMIQRQAIANSVASSDQKQESSEILPVVHEVLNSPGQPLDPSTRAFMEPRFNNDFSQVRVHTNDDAATAAGEVQARAYTFGRDIVFNRGEYAPHTKQGKRLLAHELTHVVQQGGITRESQTQQPMLQRQPDDQPQMEENSLPVSNSSLDEDFTYASSRARSAQSMNQWNKEIPYIHFEILDFYGSLVSNPAYYYYSYVWLNQAQNQNFSSNLNPGTVRNPETSRTPGGWQAAPNDLNWVFSTKFFVDSPSAPLPAQFRNFQTQSNIKFVTTDGSTAFEDHFSDNKPQYIPPLPSYSFSLSTTPFGFSSNHLINQAGTLLWDAKLRVAPIDDAIPLYIYYSAPDDCPDVAAFKKELASQGLQTRELVLDEQRQPASDFFSRHVEGIFLRIWKDAAGSYNSLFSLMKYTQGFRSFSASSAIGVECKDHTARAVSYVASLESKLSRGLFGTSGSDFVEIKGTQQVKFEPQKATP